MNGTQTKLVCEKIFENYSVHIREYITTSAWTKHDIHYEKMSTPQAVTDALDKLGDADKGEFSAAGKGRSPYQSTSTSS